MDEAITFGILLAISVGAHMAVAYLFAPPAAVRRLKRYITQDPDFSLHLSRRVGPSVVEWIKTDEGAAAFRNLLSHVGPSLAEWLETEEGRTVVGRAVAAIGATLTTSIRQWFEGQVGATDRKAQAKMDRAVLLKRALRTGNPVIDGVIGMLPDDAVRKLARRLLAIARSMTQDELQDADFRVVDEQPALGAGGDSSWFPRA